MDERINEVRDKEIDQVRDTENDEGFPMALRKMVVQMKYVEVWSMKADRLVMSMVSTIGSVSCGFLIGGSGR